MQTARSNEWSLPFLAPVEAKLEDDARAAEILRRCVRDVLTSCGWFSSPSFFSVTLPDSEPFQEFLTEYDALEKRLREKYAN